MNWSVKKTLLLPLACLFLGSAVAEAAKKTATPPSPPEGYVTAEQKRQDNPASGQSLSADGEVHITYGGRTRKIKAKTIVEGPNKMKLLLWDDYDRVDFDFVADGSQAQWWKQRSKKVKSIVQEDQSLKKALRVPIGIQEFIAQLLLKAPPPPANPSKPARYQVFYSQENLGNYPKGVLFHFTKPKLKVWMHFNEASFGKALPADAFKLDSH